jgi:hypothetical protein
MSIKNSNVTIGNRSRDLPVCSAVPQPLCPKTISKVAKRAVEREGSWPYWNQQNTKNGLFAVCCPKSDELHFLNIISATGYNRPTLCTDYYSFTYYLGSYMFRHVCAIFRDRRLCLWVTESPKWLCHQDVPLYCKCWCPVCTGYCSFVRYFVQLSAPWRWHISVETCSSSTHS